VNAQLAIEVVSELGEFRNLQHAWNQAHETSIDPNIFLSWEWISTWWHHFGKGAELNVLVVRDGDSVVGIAPFGRWVARRGPLRLTVLRPLSFDAGDYGGALLVRREADVANVMISYLCAQVRSGGTIAILPRLPSDSRLLELARVVLASDPTISAREQTLGGTCPFTDVTQNFNLAQTAKRHKIGQRWRRLTDGRTVEFAYHTGTALERGLDQLQEVHASRWAGRATELQGMLGVDPSREAFFLNAVRALDERGWVRLLTLTADDRPVAADLSFEFRSRLYMFKGAFDPEFSEFSPGQLSIHRMFEDGISRGVKTFDFMRGGHAYKSRWANGERELFTLTITRAGIRGQLAVAASTLFSRLHSRRRWGLSG
jgi:CelD/BcsL family acetyltransferase involved in cellulose biosynthesis